jgi:ribosomal protein S18 acetylase RimI-like enzyme
LVIFKLNANLESYGRKIMKDITVRNVRGDDFLKIAELAEKCNSITREKNSIYHMFTKFFRNTSFLVKDSAEKSVLGFLLGFISPVDPNNAYIHILCVKPGFGKESIAAYLLQSFFEVLRDKGCRKVYLLTKPRNKVAVSFYKTLGFKEYENDKTIDIDGLNVIRNYNGPGEHRVVFFKII